MDSKYSEDEKLLSKIRTGNESILEGLHQSYWKTFGPYFLKRKDLSLEEVKTIYASAFTNFYINIREKKLVPPLRSSLKSYLIGIGKNCMLQFFEQKNRDKETSTENLDLISKVFQNPAVNEQYEQEALAAFIGKLLLQLGPDCQRLIQLSFFEENADDAIAAKMNIPSAGAVRQRRFKCLEKLRNFLSNNNTTDE